MIIVATIFFVAIIALFGMVMFRAWEIKSGQTEKPVSLRNIFPEIYFRHTEKIVLYLARHTIQWIVLMVVKYWFISLTRTKKWFDKKLPKIRVSIEKLSKNGNGIKKIFAHRSVIELKTKIKHIREKVRKEHGE